MREPQIQTYYNKWINFVGVLILFTSMLMIAWSTPPLSVRHWVDFSSLPLGQGKWLKAFTYKTQGIVEIRQIPNTKIHYLHAQIKESTLYPGFEIITPISAPNHATLHLHWRCKGNATAFVLGIVDAVPKLSDYEKGEYYTTYVTLPSQEWSHSTIPLQQFTRDENYQPTNAPTDGKMDTDGLQKILFTFLSNDDLDMDIREIYFEWPTQPHSDTLSPLLNNQWLRLIMLGILFIIACCALYQSFAYVTCFSSSIIFNLTAVSIAYWFVWYPSIFIHPSLLVTALIFIIAASIEMFIHTRSLRSAFLRYHYLCVIILAAFFLYNPLSIPFYLLLSASMIPLLDSKDRFSLVITPLPIFIILLLNYSQEDFLSQIIMGFCFTIAIMMLIQALLRNHRIVFERENALTLYENLFHHTSDSIFMLDPDNYIKNTNHGFEILLDYEKKDLLDKNLSDFMLEGYQYLLLRHGNHSLEESRRYELCFQTRTGENRTVIANESPLLHEGTVIGYQMIATDITDRILYERDLENHQEQLDQLVQIRTNELLSANEQLREEIEKSAAIEKLLHEKSDFVETITNNLPIGIAVYHLQEGRLVYLNNKFEIICGWPKEALSHVSCLYERLFPDADVRRDVRLKLFSHNQENATKPFLCEAVSILTQDGKKPFITLMSIPMQEQDLVITTIVDVTEKHLLEEKLRQTKKMEAVGQLAGGVAHNINNLLTGIIGNLDFAKTHPHNKNYLERAEESACQAADLIKQLLGFSRKASLKLETTHYNSVVKDTYQLIRNTFDRRIDIQLQCGNSPCLIKVDRSQINSVLMNLCLNAREAIHKILYQGEFPERQNDPFQITLSTQILKHENSSQPPLASVSPGTYAKISVSDNGIGMESETQNHIFEPFFTTNKNSGNGLGLASSFGIVKQHGGWIDFSSTFGVGTTFTIYLPVTETSQETIETKPIVSENRSPNGSETILIVDDDEIIIELGKATLKQFGYKVYTAADGLEGWNFYEAHHQEIDLTILDLSMPRMTGIEVLSRIRAIAPQAKVLIASGFSADFDFETLEHLHPTDSISKPYHTVDLPLKIREILDSNPT